MAPEIVTKSPYLGKPADIWALGVLIYKLLTGIFPFKGNTDEELFTKIKRGKFSTPKNVSSEARSLINLLLKLSPEERITS